MYGTTEWHCVDLREELCLLLKQEKLSEGPTNQWHGCAKIFVDKKLISMVTHNEYSLNFLEVKAER